MHICGNWLHDMPLMLLWIAENYPWAFERAQGLLELSGLKLPWFKPVNSRACGHH